MPPRPVSVAACHPLPSYPPLPRLVSVAASTFLLLGIDQIAIEIEQPLDVLPLHAFAQVRVCDPLTLTLTLTLTPTLTQTLTLT